MKTPKETHKSASESYCKSKYQNFTGKQQESQGNLYHLHD